VNRNEHGTWTWVAATVVAFVGLVAGVALSLPVLVAVSGIVCAVSVWRLRGPARTPEPARFSRPPAMAPTLPMAPSPARPIPPPIRRIPPGLEPDVVLTALRDAAANIATPVAAHLWLADEPTGTLRRVAAVGPMVTSSQPVALEGDDVLARAAESGIAEMTAVSRVRGSGDPTMIWRYALPVSAGEARGVAAVDFQSVDEPDQTTIPMVTAPLRGSLAGALGLHVAHIELETARGLVDAARELSRLLDPDAVLEASLSRAMELSGAQTGSIMLVDPASGRLTIALSRGLSPEIVDTTSLSEGEGIAGWVLSSLQPLLIEDLPARTPAARRHGIRSAVSVPIADGDGVLGVLNVGSRTFPARFTESHLSSIEVLGKQTATALRNARAVAEVRDLYFGTLGALAEALETKDPYSRGGTARVLDLTEELGRALGLTDEERDALHIAALLHDIGMTAAGEGLALTDRPLSTVERALLTMHPQIAADILGEVPALRHVVPIVYHHHEWYDGQGYQSGLAGEDIPLGARILAVADAFVAMTSDRPYRCAFSERDALRDLSEKAGTQFDPAVVDVLRDTLRRRTEPGSRVD
jgi:response regulator RpfG family c-di-GMP phosphodiesterase